jgi:putative aminopeptidase FrvX
MSAKNDFAEFELLRKLTETPGVPGREERIRDLVLAETEGLWDETRVDALGNLICIKRATRKAGRGRGAAAGAAPKVMLSCHMDEIGFYVRFIDENGFLRLQNVGGFDTRNLFARQVLVQGRRDIVGVLNPAGRPVHIASEDEKRKIPEIKDFMVDLFLPKREVEKLVEVGDPVTLIQQTRLIGDVVTGKCMDNRVALWVGINAVRKVYGHDLVTGQPRGKRPAGPGSAYDIYFVASVQEEVGCRGATTAAYAIEPDVGIAIDTTLACDTPGIGKDEAITELGKGVALKLMDSASISHRGLFDEFVAVARQKRIPFQREILPHGGTDAGSVQRARGGTRAITLSVPTRYIHTVTESLHRQDALGAVDLLAAWLSR